MEIRDWLLTISMIGHFSYTAWSYIERRSDKTGERIGELAAQVDRLDKDVATLRVKLESTPTHDHLAEVYRDIRETNKKIDTLIGETKAQTKVIDLIHGYLMDGKA